jgi:ABC-type glutathione transport system ATPase component
MNAFVTSAPLLSRAAQSEPLLRVVGLAKVFGGSGFLRASAGVRAVDGVDLRIRAGHTMGLVGESGSGKTTLARCILRLVEPTAGRVLFRGEDVLTAGPARLRALRRDIQVVFQDPYQSLNPRLTVAEIIGEGWAIHPDVVPPERRAARIDELLDSVASARPIATAIQPSSRVASASASAWPARSLSSPASSSAMSPSRRSMSRSRRRS